MSYPVGDSAAYLAQLQADIANAVQEAMSAHETRQREAAAASHSYPGWRKLQRHYRHGVPGGSAMTRLYITETMRKIIGKPSPPPRGPSVEVIKQSHANEAAAAEAGWTMGAMWGLPGETPGVFPKVDC